jgi:hypothetical protein
MKQQNVEALDSLLGSAAIRVHGVEPVMWSLMPKTLFETRVHRPTVRGPPIAKSSRLLFA